MFLSVLVVAVTAVLFGALMAALVPTTEPADSEGET